MTKATQRVLRVLAIGVLCSLLGHLVAGCDGGASDSDAAVVLAPRPAGAISCAIPSPTGTEASQQLGPIGANHFLFVANDVRAACESGRAAALKPVCTTNPATGVVACADPSAATVKLVDGINCSDPAHDFEGSTGTPMCVYATDPDGSACSATYTSGSCVAQSVGSMAQYTSGKVQGLYVRSWALCGASGQFVGWLCTAS